MVAAVLRSRLIAGIGVISYGIFLWHHVVMVQLGDWGVLDLDARRLTLPLWVAITLAASSALAYLSWRAIERPLITWSKRAGRRRRAALGAQERREMPKEYPV